ncbi:MAG: hypothetical protein FJ125_14315, partial [Deltaproteobacteria bacterium]|nr:hypothetical protein [Deltaproteobacteria bacterium]
MRCGLALHQKAILRGWVNMDALRRAGGENDLFCLETVPTEGCPFMAGDRKDLFALQEHNRFWSSAAQIEKFAADRARSDAFLVMFRNEINPFAAGVALSYKGDKLREAVAGYDRVVKLVAGSPAASVLFAWPASGFKQSGRDWIKIFQTVASDRMDAIAELVDLRRRVFMNTGATDFLFARHLMQQEYLLHIYLMELQARWEGDLFAYAGEAGRALERGQSVVQQLDAERNALGITPDRVFFESTDPDVTNWRHYYGILAGEDGRGGKLAEVRAVVLDAVDELRAATSDLDSLEASLAAAQDSLDGSIEEICGPDGLGAVGSSGNRCLDRIKMDASAAGVSDALRNCMASGDCNREQLGCQDYTNMLSDVNSCTDMVLQFHDGLSDTCKLDRQTESVTVLGEERWCMGGAMGAVLDEKALVDLQRRQVVESVKRLAGAMQLEIEYFQRMMGAKYGTQTAIHILQIIIAIIETVEYIGLAAADFLDKSAEGVDCVLIAGLAFGTDCPTGAIAAATKVGAKTAAFTSALAVHKAISALNEIISILETVRDGIIDGLDFSRDMVASTREVEGLINEYALLVRTTMNLEAQISELQRQAQAAGEGYQAQVGYVADHLVGR